MNKIFNRHKKIERFGLTFIILSFLLIFMLVMGYFNNRKINNNLLSENAMYSTRFTTSRTNVSGTVEGVYTSEDKTRSFVLLKFNDISKVSLDADTYQAFLTGANLKRNKRDLMSNPAGSLYVFGTSGYFGVYLVDKSGFDKQILDLTIRANSEIVPVISDGRSVGGDESFKIYDQFKIYFNPAADNAEISKVLSKEEFDVVDLYNEIVISPQEIIARENIQKTLQDMFNAQTRVEEFSDRLSNISIDGVRMKIPAGPREIRKDVVQKVYKEKPDDVDIDGKYAVVDKDLVRNSDIKSAINFEENKRRRASGTLSDYTKEAKEASNEVVNNEENENVRDNVEEDVQKDIQKDKKAKDKEIAGKDLDSDMIDSRGYIYHLDTDQVVSGGYDIDWLHDTVSKGYLKDLVSSGESYSDYILRRSREDLTGNFDVANIKWMLTNGKDFDEDVLDNGSSQDLAPVREMVASRDSLMSAWRDFYTAKARYQREDMKQLIDLDYDLNNIEENYTVNQSEKVLLLY